jgi:orotate phosphoribosyltransferase
LHRSVLRSTGTSVDHNRADEEAFAVVEGVTGLRVLLVDDTFTTGARAQSAASALRRANARVVVVLAVGRVISPQWNDNCRAIWEQAQRREFRFDECCWCPEG